jgi:hypothetical protein
MRVIGVVIGATLAAAAAVAVITAAIGLAHVDPGLSRYPPP